MDQVESRAGDGSPLDKVLVADSLSRELGNLADLLVDHFVQETRAAGNSWSQIGFTLGMSKQGAQQGYSAPAPPPPDASDPLASQIRALEEIGRESQKRGTRRMKTWLTGALQFQRFTREAREVVVDARKQAHSFHHSHIGPEHILLGILSANETVAARALRKLEVDGELAMARVRQEVGAGSASGTGHIPFTEEAKKTLELALREAIRLKHNYIGTEHILLALVRSDNSAVRLLQGIQITPDQVRQAVAELLESE